MFRQSRGAVLGIFLALVGTTFVACENDDGDDGLNLEERYSDLGDRVSELSDDAQREAEALWDDAITLFSEWQQDAGPAAEDVERQLDQLLSDLEERLDNVTE